MLGAVFDVRVNGSPDQLPLLRSPVILPLGFLFLGSDFRFRNGDESAREVFEFLEIGRASCRERV